ncbi:hypothetical protein EV182_001720 [Spiromyces aspiralis]|uniref:Uncharacterized protein n=1 Tax=Spiromyces aspiralis TaxID=68401 RepID=A0ACC1HGR4_9FUNG|nr:hypothetical protein EV182_001720 [Spiromyces aspiralis]
MKFIDSFGATVWALVFYAAVGVVAFVLLKFVILPAGTRRPRQNTVMILGPMNSGKTTLWAQVSVHLMDIPGHPKLRGEFDQYTPITKGIIFMVDSSALGSDVQDTAEYVHIRGVLHCGAGILGLHLYDILIDKHVQNNEIPILIVCHKQDRKGALGKDRVFELLASEIDKLRSTRQNALQEHDADEHGGGAENDERAQFLGLDGKSFEFDDLVNPVAAVESGTRMDGEDFKGFEDIKQWVVRLFEA